MNELQEAILASTAKYTYDQGGVGSGKTIGACVKHVLLMATVPGNRGVVARESIAKLHDTTHRIYQDVLQRYQDVTGADIQYRANRDGYSHHIVFPNGSEVFFRPTEKIELGPEYGAILIDEAQEEIKRSFTKLQERLRLPAAGPYLWFGLLSNPPKRGHWLHEVFGEIPGKHLRGTSYFELRISSTRKNKHLPPGYIEDLIFTHGPEGARRVLDGLYSFEAEGKQVYTTFDTLKHVGSVILRPDLPLTRSWDFGLRHPAVTWHQSYICKFKTVHWNILAEVTDLTDVELGSLAQAVIDKHQALFPLFPARNVLDCGDRSGMNKRDTSPGSIETLRRKPWYINVKYGQFEINDGVDLLIRRLRSSCVCGQPVVFIDRDCTGVIEMFAGGYHWPKERPSQGPKDNPRKDHWYDDIADSVRYYLENYIRPKLLDNNWPGELQREGDRAKPLQSDYAWMEGTLQGPVYDGPKDLQWVN